MWEQGKTKKIVTPAEAGVGLNSVRDTNQKRTKYKFEHCKFHRPYSCLRRNDKEEKTCHINRGQGKGKCNTKNTKCFY